MPKKWLSFGHKKIKACLLTIKLLLLSVLAGVHVHGSSVALAACCDSYCQSREVGLLRRRTKTTAAFTKLGACAACITAPGTDTHNLEAPAARSNRCHHHGVLPLPNLHAAFASDYSWSAPQVASSGRQTWLLRMCYATHGRRLRLGHVVSCAWQRRFAIEAGCTTLAERRLGIKEASEKRINTSGWSVWASV
jgi:hypothetical protein